MKYPCRTNAPWGLQRITQAGPVNAANVNSLAYTYSWNDATAGTGVDVYVLDTVSVFVSSDYWHLLKMMS